MLTSLITGLRKPRSDQAASPSDDSIWTRAGFHLSRGRKTIRDWAPWEATLRDATGNQVGWEGMDSYQRGDTTYFAFEPSLGLDEPAWKLRVEFAPSSETPIASDDQWIMPDIQFPQPHTFRPAKTVFSRHGVMVRRPGVAGPHTRLPNGSRSCPEAATIVLKSNQSLYGLWLVLLRAVDDHGRLCQTPTTMSSTVADCIFTLGLKPRSGARRARVVFALSPSRFVEFTVHPTRA